MTIENDFTPLFFNMDYIFIDELRLPVLIGVHPREQAIPQIIEVSLRIGISTMNAGKSDQLSDTIDYASVVECVRNELPRQHFKLLERLAEHLAELLMERFGANWVRICLAKPGALPNVKRAGIVIERGVPA